MTPQTAPWIILFLPLVMAAGILFLGGKSKVLSAGLAIIGALVACALSWWLFLLSQSPQWSERVAAEAERECEGPAEGLSDRMVATRAVIEEAIRLYPPLAAISREAIAPDELAGHPIAAGTTVVIAPYVLHRHRRLWQNPDLFDPTLVEHETPVEHVPVRDRVQRGVRGAVPTVTRRSEAWEPPWRGESSRRRSSVAWPGPIACPA